MKINLHTLPGKVVPLALIYAGFLLGLFFDSEAEGDMFLRNVG
jgi:hypothetical protein